jgi:hypothetical protein
MKSTLDLPDPLMRQIKIRIAGEGRKLKDLVAELFDLGLAAANPLRQVDRLQSLITDHRSLGTSS